MKYLGEKSVSSTLSALLGVGWYGALLFFIFATVMITIILFATPVDTPSLSAYDQFNHALFTGLEKDDETLLIMKSMPGAVRGIVVVYCITCMGMLLSIISKAQLIFNNFKQNIVFSDLNVQIISQLTKLIILFSLISFNFSSLLIGIILLILTDILKNGTALQEEHDLTI